MENVKIKWKDSSRVKCDPILGAHELERIWKENDGNIPDDELIRNSKPKDAPFHNDFEWNDKRCGVAYRRQQAQYIKRSIVYVPISGKPQAEVRVYETVSLPPKVEGEKPRTVWTKTEEIMKDPILRDQLLSQAIRDAITFRKKYHSLSELAKIFSAMDQFLEEAI